MQEVVEMAEWFNFDEDVNDDEWQVHLPSLSLSLFNTHTHLTHRLPLFFPHRSLSKPAWHSRQSSRRACRRPMSSPK